MLFIGYQAYENKEAGRNRAMSNLEPNDESFSSRNIINDCLMSCMINRYYENNDRQERQAIMKKKKVKSMKSTTVASKSKKKDTTKKPKEVATKKPEEFTTKKARKWRSKYLEMKYKLYDDINALREKYFKPPLQVNKSLSIELQNYVQKYIKGDKDLKPREPSPDEIYYFCSSDEEYDPIKYWSKDEHLLTYENIYDDKIDLFYTKLLWKSSTHIGCGVYGDERGIATFCKITPRGNIKGEYKENIFN
uniref:SCP domain-containing protein n=1 Tax=Strongyloides papillosus TaxID=174720 RepID=A0A0N5CAY7_STREA